MKHKEVFVTLSDTELFYMQEIWDHPEGINSYKFYEGLRNDKRSKIGNVLSHLVKKGCARAEKEGRHNIYFANFSQSDYKKMNARNQVEKLIPKETNMVNLIAAFCGKTELTEKEISKISDFLDKLEKDLNNESN